MSNVQLWCVILAFAILVVTMIVAWRKWLPAGPVSMTGYALAGAAIPLVLWWGDMPPQWFEGDTSIFILGGMLMLSSFAFYSKEERTFRLPFLLTFGLTLVILNVAAHL